MAGKTLRPSGKRIAPRKPVDKTESNAIILVGTYKERQLAWIKKNGLYNYPIKGEDSLTLESCGNVKELWLYAGAKARRHCFTAEFIGVQTKDEFLARNPTYAKLGPSRHARYMVFRTSFLDYGSRLEDAAVVARLNDFCGGRSKKVAAAIRRFHDEGEFGSLADYLPSELGTLPRKRLMVCEPVVQLEFWKEPEKVSGQPVKAKTRLPGRHCLRFIDLFAGIGGMRTGFEQACSARGIETQCVFTSEIKPHAIEILKQNHPDECIHGDITKVDEKDMPDFDVLLGGFPCQAFSAAGKRLGFEDTRGTLFFDVARILKEKRPGGFVLENVEGLVNHDRRDPKDRYGHTLKVILATLDELGYKVCWRVLNASDFGVPQDRRRIYIVGSRKGMPDLQMFKKSHATISTVLEHGVEAAKSRFIDQLLSHYSVDELKGKAIKDKRGGDNNIHSWDFEYKGKVSQKQRKLLNALLRERRKHQWAEQYGIDWMDGMPLTLEMIRTFYDDPRLEEMLEDLVAKRYVVKEHPKRKMKDGKAFVRVQDTSLPVGYNIVAGKMSFEISKVMAPDEIAPTLVAMDMQHLYVVDSGGLRTLTLREGLGMFGYPRSFKFDIQKDLGYDLLGNTVVVPVIKAVSGRLLEAMENE